MKRINGAELAERTAELTQLYEKQRKASAQTSQASGQYENEKRTHRALSEKAKKFKDTGDRKAGYVNLVIAVLCVVAAVIAAVLFVSSIAGTKKAADVVNDPGAEYEEWVASWPNYTSFDELEEGWKTVQNAWEARGVEVDWTYIVKVKDGMNRSVITPDSFGSALKAQMEEDFGFEAGFSLLLAFVFLPTAIAALIFGIKSKRAFGRYRKDTKEKETNAANLHECEEKVKVLQAVYEAEKEKLEEITQTINAKLDFLPEILHQESSVRELQKMLDDARHKNGCADYTDFGEDFVNQMIHTLWDRALWIQSKVMEAEREMREERARKAENVALIRCSICRHYNRCTNPGLENCPRWSSDI